MNLQCFELHRNAHLPLWPLLHPQHLLYAETPKVETEVEMSHYISGNMAIWHPHVHFPSFLSLFHPSFKEPVFPGQHMFDQQHSASVLDTNPLLAGPAPMGSIHPPGYESDPLRPSPALQGPTDLSKPGSSHRGHCSLQKNPSAQSGCPFTAPSRPQAQVILKDVT